MIWVRRVLIAVAVFAVTLPGPASAAPEHAEIVFGHGSEIWAARADGSERRPLIEPTRGRETLGQPACSVVQTARALGIDRFELEGRLRMRRALRSLGAYRYAGCSSPRSRSRTPGHSLSSIRNHAVSRLRPFTM